MHGTWERCMGRFFLFLSLLLVFASSLAGSPLAHFQFSGRLSSGTGTSLAGSAVVSMTASLFGQETGGTAAYIQTLSSVEVEDGFFSLEIGPALPDLITNSYLELEVQGQVLQPRRKLLAMPFAIQAANSEKLGGQSSEELRTQLKSELGFQTGTANLTLSGLGRIEASEISGSLVEAGELTITGNVNSQGTITAQGFSGDGSNLTNLPSVDAFQAQTLTANLVEASEIKTSGTTIIGDTIQTGTVESVTISGASLKFTDSIFYTQSLQAGNLSTFANIDESSGQVFVTAGKVTATTVDASFFTGDGAGLINVLHPGDALVSEGNFTLNVTSTGGIKVNAGDASQNTIRVSLDTEDSSGNVQTAFSVDSEGDVFAGSLDVLNANISGHLRHSSSTLHGNLSNTHINLATLSNSGSPSTTYGYISIAGGQNHEAANDFASIGAGNQNTAIGYASRVGGGAQNLASNQYSYVGGGGLNEAKGDFSTVPGGFQNTAQGDFSAVLGGQQNVVTGNHSALLGGSLGNIDANHAFLFNGTGTSQTLTSGLTGAAVFMVSRLGVGTTTPNPGYLADFNGDVNIRGKLFDAGEPVVSSPFSVSSTSILYNAGKVGIGATNPDVELVVGGRVRLEPTTSSDGDNGSIRWTGQDLEIKSEGEWESVFDDGEILSEFQALDTSGARAVESMIIGTDTYLAIAQLYSSGFELNSPIFKWDGNGFSLFQTIPTTGAEDFESFSVGGNTFLAVANKRDAASFHQDSKVYQWTGSQFSEVQSIPTTGAFDLEYFEIYDAITRSTDRFLAVANYRDSVATNSVNFLIDSIIYKWNGSQFSEFQSIPTSGAKDWESFEISGTPYLAVANFRVGGQWNQGSRIYQWNGSQFIEFQSIPTAGAYDWESFEIDGVMYLAVANHYTNTSFNTNSKIYKWNGSQFDEFQSIPTNGARDWEFFERNDRKFLAFANYSNDLTTNIRSKIFEWNGSTFEELGSEKTSGGSDWHYLEIDLNPYLVMANDESDGDFTVNSVVYTPEDPVFGGSAPTTIADKDSDTAIEVEAGSDTDEIRLKTNGVGRMIVTSNGLVGIGTVSPVEALDVAGNIIASGDVTGTNLSGTLQTAAQPNVTSLGTLGTVDIDGGSIDGTVIGANGSAAGSFTDVEASNGMNVGFSATPAANTVSIGDANHAVSLNTNGDPVYAFDVNDFIGYIRSSDELRFVVNNADAIRILSDGKVGMGTNSPTEKLDVSGNINATGNIMASGDLTGTNLTGTLQTAAQPNVTSLGTLGSVDIDGGNIDGAVIGSTTPAAATVTTLFANSSLEVSSSLTVTASGLTISSANIIGTLTAASFDVPSLDLSGTLTAATIDLNGGTMDDVTIGGTTPSTGTFTDLNGTLQTVAQPNITSIGTLGTVDIDGGNIDSTTIGANTASSGEFTNLTATIISGTLQTAAQPNITSVGTLATADIDGGTLDDVAIGATTAATATFTDITATQGLNVGFSGTPTADVVSIGDANHAVSLNTNGDPVYAFDVNDFMGYIRSSDELRFVVNNADAIRILSDGKVGMGTNSPSEKLDVSGNINATGNISASGDLTAANITASGDLTTTNITGTLQTAAQPNISSVGTLATADIDGGTLDDVTIGATTAANATFTDVIATGDLDLSSSATPLVTLDANDYIEYDKSNNKMKFSANNHERLVIDGNSWHVQARSAQSMVLDINAGDNTYSNIHFNHSDTTNKWSISSRASFDTPNDRLGIWNAGAASEKFTIHQTGGVGIGTNTPNELLEVADSATHAHIVVRSPDASKVVGLNLLHSNTSGWLIHSRGTYDTGGEPDNRLAIYAGLNEKFTFTEDGELGIGTTTPTATLEVNGNVLATSMESSGAMTATTFYGDGSQLTGISSGGTSVSFSVILTSSYTLATGSLKQLVFRTEVFDYSGNFSTNSGKFTAPVSGVYFFNAANNYNLANGAEKTYQLFLYKNASQMANAEMVSVNGTSHFPKFSLSKLTYLDLGDTVEVKVAQYSGSDELIQATAAGTYFEGYLIHEVTQ